MSVLNKEEINRQKTFLEGVESLAGRFDDAIYNGPKSTLEWLKEALPTLDRLGSPLLDWKGISQGLKQAGYQGAGLGNVDSSKPEDFAKAIIGQIVTAIDTGDMVGLDRRAYGSVNKALQGLSVRPTANNALRKGP
jgi:hypothetical protein